MAMDELKDLGEEIILAFKHDSAMFAHAEIFDRHLRIMTTHLQALRDEMKGISRNVGEIVLAASLDLSSTPQSFVAEGSLKANNNSIAQYAKDGHFGIACVLQLNRLMDLPAPPHLEVTRFIDYRNKLLVDVDNIVARSNFRSSESRLFDTWLLKGTQLFVPRTICRIPAVLADMRRDGRVDYLFRPVSQIAHDSGERHLLPLDLSDAECNATDGLGRSLLHSLALRSNDELDQKTSAAFLENHTLSLGLTALHIAAIKGRVQIFEVLQRHKVRVIEHLQARSGPTGRTCLHWAASCGQLGVTRSLYTLAGADFRELIDDRDRQGDTPLHLAARYGHTEIVRTLLSPLNWDSLKVHRRHTPFWAAVSGGHLETMNVLEPYSNVDQDESNGMTPLAEAARNGFIEGVKYLLSLNYYTMGSVDTENPKRVNTNSLNSRWNADLKRSELRTPLDLAIEGKHDECIRNIQEYGGITWEALTSRD
jgi:ankyrin repeat protein